MKQKRNNRRWALAALLLLALSALLAPAARAQFIGYTFPQTVTQTLTSGTACTGTAQTFTANNLGQTVHFATIITSTQTSLQAFFQGDDGAGHVAVISDVATISLSSPAIITAVGYYTKVEVVVKCSPNSATFAINYAGTSASVPTGQGQALSGLISKTIASSAPAGTSLAQFFVPPYGNESGYLTAEFLTAAGPAASSITISCAGGGGGLVYGSQTWPLATTQNAVQIFPVSALPCPNLAVQYTSGGSSSAVISIAVAFNSPGLPQQFAYAHVTAAGPTLIKTGAGFLHGLTMGTTGGASASPSVTIWDGACLTGTEIADISTVTTAAPPTWIFDVNFSTELCIVNTLGTSADDLTFSYN